jgi:hypothetical protein
MYTKGSRFEKFVKKNAIKRGNREPPLQAFLQPIQNLSTSLRASLPDLSTTAFMGNHKVANSFY